MNYIIYSPKGPSVQHFLQFSSVRAVFSLRAGVPDMVGEGEGGGGGPVSTTLPRSVPLTRIQVDPGLFASVGMVE